MVSRIKYIVLIVLIFQLTGCTLAGVILDGQANNSRSNSTKNAAGSGVFVKDSEAKSFGELGEQIDKSIINFIIDTAEKKPQLKCRQITRTIKECEEIGPPHSSNGN
nr:hypothetical protein [Lelliottia steviae]